MIQTQESDKLEDVGNAEAVYILYGGLGDQVCASGSLNQFFKQYNKKLYIISDKPSLFCAQDYCKEAISLDVLSGDGAYDQSPFFKKFEKIHTLFWQNEKHLKGENTIVESYCDQLKVKKVKYPFFKINKNDLSSKNKPYILVSLKRPDTQKPFIASRNKFLSDKTNAEFFLKLKKDLKDFDIFDLGQIQISSFYDLLVVVANCTTFVSVDTALQHLAADEFCQKKGVVLWNNKQNISLYGYDINENLFDEFIQPYDNYDIILKKLLQFIKC